MADECKKVFEALNPGAAAPAALAERRAAVLSQLKALEASCQPLLAVIEDVPLTEGLREQGNFIVDYLRQYHQVFSCCCVFLLLLLLLLLQTKYQHHMNRRCV
jgi:hypothetical protein